MRITVEFLADKEIRLPIHYNYILQGFLYKNLSDKDYRNFLHKTGYFAGSRQFKLFTYSRLLGRFKIHKEECEISFFPPFKLVISSAVEQFITDLAETLIRSDFSFMGKHRAEVASINVHKDFVFSDNIQIKMLSPMVAYSTVIEDGRKRTEYYSPWNEKFTEIAKNNLLAKHEIIYGFRPANDEFRIVPNGNQEHKFARIINYKGTYIKAYAGIYWLAGNPDLIKIAYDTGLGSKNSQGFGCWEVTKF
ncbi:MAG: CRISPR-associated endoribonuclease Cas6 [Syntrophomonadaceae bacterium]|nr:CRISPR-associated endoribonuclease Cas6 [Syntrophomonadaceae bacterium]